MARMRAASEIGDDDRVVGYALLADTDVFLENKNLPAEVKGGAIVALGKILESFDNAGFKCRVQQHIADKEEGPDPWTSLPSHVTASYCNTHSSDLRCEQLLIRKAVGRHHDRGWSQLRAPCREGGERERR